MKPPRPRNPGRPGPSTEAPHPRAGLPRLRMTWPMYRRFEAQVRDTIVRLSLNERELLAALLMNRPRPLPMSDLIAAVWPMHEPRSAAPSIRNAIRSLRAMGVPIVSVSGRGYRIEKPLRTALTPRSHYVIKRSPR